MKLNYKRVFFVSLAFFLITLFWQCYDTLIPKILTDKFGMSQTLSGIFMAFDNVLALFLLPVFGAISDRSRFKLGKRLPFILVGTIVSCVLFVSLSFADYWQLTNIEKLRSDDTSAVMSELYRADLGDISDEIREKYATEEDFAKISVYQQDDAGNNVLTNEYKNYVIPARQAYA